MALNKELIDKIIIGMLANGHLLLEGVPGLAKTLTVSTLANSINTSFQRIQFTPDMLPADLIGTLIFNQKTSGFETKNLRSRESSKLLTYGLTNFDLVQISKKDEPFDNVEVWLGKADNVKVYTEEDIYKIIKKGQKKKLKAKITYEGPIEAPIKKDQIVAKLRIIYDEEQIGEYDLLAIKEVKKVNIFSRLMKSLNYLIWGDV